MAKRANIFFVFVGVLLISISGTCRLYAQSPTLPDIKRNLPLEEKLKIIDGTKKIGLLECYVDDTLVLDKIAGKSFVRELEILGRYAVAETGLERLPMLPAINSLKLIGISPASVHHILSKIKKDSLRSLSILNCSLESVDPVVASFRNLAKLDLSINNLVSWPIAINQLEKITELYLSSNKLIEFRPANLKLKRLSVSRNQISPASLILVALPQLEKIDLSENKIGQLPGNFGELYPRLQDLDVSNNMLQNLPASLSKCTGLHFLRLYKNAIRDFPPVIAQLKQLWVLDLGYNALDSIPASIYELKKLQHLNISGNFLTALPGDLDKLPSLQELNTEGNFFRETPHVILSIIAENKKLPNGKAGEISSFPKIKLTQNILPSDTMSYKLLQHPSFNAATSTLEIKDHFPGDFRFFGHAGIISITGIKDSLWPPVLLCFSSADEIEIRNSVIDITLLYPWLATQTNLKKLKLVNCNIRSFPENLLFPNSLNEIDLSNNPITVLPESFCKLQQLRDVYLYNNLVKTIPECLIGKLHVN